MRDLTRGVSGAFLRALLGLFASLGGAEAIEAPLGTGEALVGG